MKEPGFNFMDHTADVQVECFGRTLEQAFEQAAYSLMTIISPNLKLIEQKIKRDIHIEAEDKEALLFDFLSEFLYIFDVDGLIFSKINVTFVKKKNDQFELSASIMGEVFKRSKHKIGTEVKAITYSFMEIEENKEQVKIKVVFDI
jgi:SHS2 domain-containing protein